MKFAISAIFFAQLTTARQDGKALFQACGVGPDVCQGTSFLELNSCMCFRREFCDEKCPEDLEMSPIDFCKCIDENELRSLFPSDMMMEEIRSVMDYQKFVMPQDKIDSYCNMDSSSGGEGAPADFDWSLCAHHGGMNMDSDDDDEHDDLWDALEDIFSMDSAMDLAVEASALATAAAALIALN